MRDFLVLLVKTWVNYRFSGFFVFFFYLITCTCQFIEYHLVIFGGVIHLLKQLYKSLTPHARRHQSFYILVIDLVLIKQVEFRLHFLLSRRELPFREIVTFKAKSRFYGGASSGVQPEVDIFRAENITAKRLNHHIYVVLFLEGAVIFMGGGMLMSE